jgi:hypothetical protein
MSTDLQRKRLVKHLLNKNSKYVSLSGALVCFMCLHLERCKWPGPLQMSERPSTYKYIVITIIYRLLILQYYSKIITTRNHHHYYCSRPRSVFKPRPGRHVSGLRTGLLASSLVQGNRRWR